MRSPGLPRTRSISLSSISICLTVQVFSSRGKSCKIIVASGRSSSPQPDLDVLKTRSEPAKPDSTDIWSNRWISNCSNNSFACGSIDDRVFYFGCDFKSAALAEMRAYLRRGKFPLLFRKHRQKSCPRFASDRQRLLVDEAWLRAWLLLSFGLLLQFSDQQRKKR